MLSFQTMNFINKRKREMLQSVYVNLAVLMSLNFLSCQFHAYGMVSYSKRLSRNMFRCRSEHIIVHNSTIPGCIVSIIRDNIALLYFQMLIYRVFRHFTPPLQSPLNYLNCIRVWICVWCALYTSRTMYAVPTEIAWTYDSTYIKYSKSPKSTRLRLRRKQ